MKKSLLLLLLVFGSTQIYSQATNKEIAHAYIEAYSNWDFEKMSSFYHDSVYFVDPTAIEAFPIGTYEHKGKVAVKQFFSSVFNNGQPEYVNLIVKQEFTSGNIFVFHSNFECILPNSWFGEQVLDKIFISIPLDTILKVEDGKIVSHTDYGGYSIYNKQIKAQLPK